jgi:hypothetical protein
LMMASRWTWIVLTGLLLVGCGGDDGVELRSSALLIESEDEGLGVDDLDAERPVAGSPSGSVVYLGLVEPERVAEVSWVVPGTIESIDVGIGDKVRRGQVLGRLQTDDRRLRLDETKKRFRDARASRPAAVARGSDGPPPQWVVDEARRIHEDAAKTAERSRADLARVRRRARTNGEEGAADLAVAIHKSRTARPSTRAVRRANEDALAVALVDDLDQRIRQLSDAIDNSSLKAPLAGIVIGIQAGVGEVWNTRTVEPAFQIVDPRSFVVTVVIPVERARQLTSNEVAWVEIPGAGGDPPTVAIAHSQSVADEAVTLTGSAGGSVAWTNAIFKLPAELPRHIFVGEEARVALGPPAAR